MEAWIKEYLDLIGDVTPKLDNIEKAYQIKYPNIPEILYRFRPLSNEIITIDGKNYKKSELELENFENNQIWLSSPFDFNDPYDSKPLFNPDIILKESLNDEKIKKIMFQNAGTEDVNSEEFKEKFKQILKLYQTLFLDITLSLRIGCFTQNNYTNILMWSHYANCHSGYCIEYDMTQIQYENFFSRFMYPVIYSKDIFDLSGHLISALKYSIYKEQPFNNLIAMVLIPLFKAAEWGYEKEWRLIYDAKNLLMKSNLANAPVPKTIYLGTKIDAVHKEKLINIARRKQIGIYEMQMKGNEYSLIKNSL